MQAVSEFIQPILIALTVLLIPATARFATGAMAKKLDEGRAIAMDNREELKKATAEEAKKVSDLLEQHRTELLNELGAIKAQTTATNGRVTTLELDVAWLKGREGGKPPSAK